MGVIMNIAKSLVVIFLMLAIVVPSVTCVIKCVQKHKKKELYFKHVVISVFCLVITSFCIAMFGDYVNPFERKVDTKLIAAFPLSEEYQSSFPGEQFWHGAYESWFPYAESFYFNPESREKYDIPLPFFNFKQHSYIFTYGQEIDNLTYNVWNTIDYPLKTGAKVGNIVFKNEFIPQTMYIYEIPKIRIENDINNTFKNQDSIPAAENIFWDILFVCIVCIVIIQSLMFCFKDRKKEHKTGDGLREP